MQDSATRHQTYRVVHCNDGSVTWQPSGGVTFPLSYDFAPKVQGVITNTHFSLITIDPTTNNTVYVGLRGKTDPFWGPDIGALFKSTDGGQTFGADLLADCHLNHNPGDWQDCAITSLAIDRQNPNVLWIGQDGWNALAQTLMRPSDGGATWHAMLTTISTFTAVSIPKASNHVVWALLQKQLDGQWVYYTTDTGATWHQAKVDSTGNPAHRTIAADPFDPSAAWVSAGEERLKHTADSNVSWQSLTNSEFHSVAVVESNLLIGAAAWPPGTASVQLSVDGGATWTAIGEATMYGLADGNNAQSLSVVSQ